MSIRVWILLEYGSFHYKPVGIEINTASNVYFWIGSTTCFELVWRWYLRTEMARSSSWENLDSRLVDYSFFFNSNRCIQNLLNMRKYMDMKNVEYFVYCEKIKCRIQLSKIQCLQLMKLVGYLKSDAKLNCKYFVS